MRRGEGSKEESEWARAQRILALHFSRNIIKKNY
jgi:hypothetical protein